ncbi:DUF262 domain-containing HNH endonuclease family protein [Acidithiobacillus sp.]|uniref:DUF262 domain-containing protein n=1 Tax=Acidithiobacillus sp. TaxID=1872118 RepID=UPI0025C718BE|nr:DUF262 domain-containing HNH endonuclease family protein [Acidithiobacillus sp.]
MNHRHDEANKLHPELLTIGEVFGGTTHYTVPIYQRNYAWQMEQIEQMLSDIYDAMDVRRGDYFLGNIIVAHPESGVYKVIDGQQRLTSLYLLLSQLGHTAHRGLLQYEARQRAAAALEKIASEDFNAQVAPDAPHGEDETTGIWQGWKYISQYLRQHFKGEDSKSKLEIFKKYVLGNVTVVRTTLPEGIDFNRYFEIMNTRGRQLQQVDIVKARLMAHLVDDAERDCFAWIWNACADMDAYVQIALKHENKELRTQVFGDNCSFVSVTSFDELLKCLETNPGQHGAGGINESVGLADAIKAYGQKSVEKTEKNKDTVHFRSIITFPSFLLHVLKIVQKDDADENEGHLDDKMLVKRFTKFLNGTELDKRNKAKEFAFELLRCRNLFDSYVIKREFTGTSDDDGDWSLKILFKDGFYKNTYSTKEKENEDDDTDAATKELLMLESMLRVTYTSPRTMHWITRLLRVLAKKHQGSKTIEESVLVSELRGYARDKLKDAFFDGEEQPQGFSIERIVFTYLDYLLWKEKPRPDFRFTFRNSIEHFYPQNPRDGQSGNGSVSKNLIDCLGNLALLSVSDNSRFSNDLPETKATYEHIINQSQKLKKMTEIAKIRWDDAAVLDHHREMVSLLKRDLEQKYPGIQSHEC